MCPRLPIAMAIFAAWFHVPGVLPAQEGPDVSLRSFASPDFSKRLIRMESVILGSEDRGDLVSLLVALAVNPSLDAVAAPLREKALALALQINPVDRDRADRKK